MSQYKEIESSEADVGNTLAPKLRGYLYVKHNPTSRNARARILRKVSIVKRVKYKLYYNLV